MTLPAPSQALLEGPGNSRIHQRRCYSRKGNRQKPTCLLFLYELLFHSQKMEQFLSVSPSHRSLPKPYPTLFSSALDLSRFTKLDKEGGNG